MVIAAPTLNFKPKQATLPVKSFLQRLMLVTDGRITDIIQAYSGETVEAVKLHQKLVKCDSQLSSLQLESKQQVIERSIVLQGTTSKTNYLYADSYLVLERLDPEIRNKLIFSRQPIGKLLRENKIETYREIIDCGIEPAGKLAKYFKIEANAEIIYRTYLVLMNGLPAMQITEKFPTSHFVD
ncbi:DUF98 domain-containing protein [Waterburya agarophytonicola K14]|uniref:DUF98 domain-containing protein n=1 Tax=Waterburya agarophytonicola KI4 TaxID=2874699 RepID=A0A964BSH7_9CYAN|nr:chorismate pyruvate-lyase family protein [Waterburya agarophytonicola]MCC0177683.1 DUF98 domain-containing protein [Waterburya agarophytonicola KI4]